MLKTFALSMLAFLLFTLNAFGQSDITITPKKTLHTRKGAPANRRTVTVRSPVIGGAIDPAAKKKLENTISYWRVFETSLKESLSDTWLSSLDYKVNYNRNGILDISLIMEGLGAYPSTSIKNLVVNAKTGEEIKFADAFKTDSLEQLAQMVDEKLGAEKQEILKSIEADKEESKESKDAIKEQLGGLQFTVENLNAFSLSDKGVTILYDAGFPHAIQALQPDGRYFFTFAELKPFIKSDGLLGQFVR